MSLDDKTKRAMLGVLGNNVLTHMLEVMDPRILNQIDEIMGLNVLRQIVTVVPDFFDGGYIVTNLVPKPKEEQSKHGMVKYLEPKIVVSTHPRYKANSRVDVEDKLAELTKKGFNVTISPERIRNFSTDSKTLGEYPCDNLVIAQVPSDEKGFGNPYVFYDQDSYLGRGWKIGFGQLPKGELYQGLRYLTHFAFVPQGEEKRKSCFIEGDWELKK